MSSAAVAPKRVARGIWRPAPLTRAPLAIVLFLLFGLLACSGTSTDGPAPEEDRTAVREMLGAYLPLLAEAYESGNVEVLRGLAAEKEMASLLKRISELMEQENRVLAPELQSFELEQVELWNYSNAFVTTLEVWDLRVLASGSEDVLSESIGQRNRVKYQLKRQEDGSWQVLFRTIEDTLQR